MGRIVGGTSVSDVIERWCRRSFFLGPFPALRDAGAVRFLAFEKTTKPFNKTQTTNQTTTHNDLDTIFTLYSYHLMSVYFNKYYDSWQRISWFSQRWRTQQNAIRNVNCKTPWIIKSLNANGSNWFKHNYYTCLSIVSFLFYVLL